MTAIGTSTSASKETLLGVLARLQKEGAALGHFNVADQTLFKAVVAAAWPIPVSSTIRLPLRTAEQGAARRGCRP